MNLVCPLAELSPTLVLFVPIIAATIVYAVMDFSKPRDAPQPVARESEVEQPAPREQAPMKPCTVQAMGRIQRAGRTIDQRGAAILQGVRPVVNVNDILTGRRTT